MRKLLRTLALLAVMALLPGCGIIDMIYLPPPEDTPQEIYESASEAMAEHDYVTAVQLITKLRDAFPFSPYVVDAELMLGDAYFLDEEYELATEAYKDFESLHPRHPAIEYVLYQTGVSLQMQFPSIDRPTTMLQEAIAYYERVLQQYPDSKYADAARERILQCRKGMAEHELYIADMFWHMNKYGPAWHRYTYVADNFQDVPEVASHASARAVVAYRKYTYEDNEERREAREGTWKDWFRWL